jgi:MoaA/NifB/PqqE/SkfB family radical SAM enzyme
MEDSSVFQVKYGDFSQRLHEKGVKKGFPLNGEIDLTYRCNLKCGHCYGVCEPDKKELATGEVIRILDEMKHAGCLWLLLSGGEALLREDFREIYACAKKEGFIITLFTNGTLITPEVAACLREYRPFSVEVSLYGITRDTYESVTGVAGSFDRCMGGINLLLEHGLPLKIKTTVVTLNYHELWQIKRYVEEELKVEFRFDAVISPKLDGSRGPCNLRVSPEEVVKLDLTDEKRLEGWKEVCERFWGSLHSDTLYSCGAGVSSFHIDPYGEMRLCSMARNPGWNLRQLNFQEGWQRLHRFRLQKSFSTNSKCRGCEIALCDWCPGWAQVENGDMEAPVEYLCRIAHLQARAFGIVKEKGGDLNEKGKKILSKASDKRGQINSRGGSFGKLQVGYRSK